MLPYLQTCIKTRNKHTHKKQTNKKKNKQTNKKNPTQSNLKEDIKRYQHLDYLWIYYFVNFIIDTLHYKPTDLMIPSG